MYHTKVIINTSFKVDCDILYVFRVLECHWVSCNHHCDILVMI